MYIIDHDKQIALIREMKQLRRNSKKYEVYYHHPYTNQMWKSFFPQAEGDELGPKLLRHEPAPANIEEQLSICLKEEAPENAVGLGIEWSAKPELWPVVIKTLEKQYAHYNRKQLKLFLDNLNFDEIGVDLNEVEEQEKPYVTADLIDDLVWRSRKIRLKRFFVFG
jgi:hypothetical protein